MTVAVGVISGLGSMALGLFLHLNPAFSLRYSNTGRVHENFYEGISNAAPLRRFLAMWLCGLMVATAWWSIYRFGKAIPSVADLRGTYD